MVLVPQLKWPYALVVDTESLLTARSRCVPSQAGMRFDSAPCLRSSGSGRELGMQLALRGPEHGQKALCWCFLRDVTCHAVQPCAAPGSCKLHGSGCRVAPARR